MRWVVTPSPRPLTPWQPEQLAENNSLPRLRLSSDKVGGLPTFMILWDLPLFTNFLNFLDRDFTNITRLLRSFSGRCFQPGMVVPCMPLVMALNKSLSVGIFPKEVDRSLI